jgi:hypothetical protein
MKRMTTLAVMLLVYHATSAQTIPCADIISHGFTSIGNSGSNCTSKVNVDVAGDPFSQKNLQIAVYVGSIDPANLVAQSCNTIPINSPSTNYESPAFTVPCIANIIYVIRTGPPSITQCSGGGCVTYFTLTFGPLPIVLASFNAKRANNSIDLNWVTSSEINANHFVIQKKSADGFIDLTTIKAGKKTTGDAYYFQDKNAGTSLSQYRLKMMDNDGFVTYSEIRAVKATSGIASDFYILPNPSSGDVKVIISDVSKPAFIQLMDNSGRVLRNQPVLNSSSVDFKNLQSGMYLIRMTNKNSGNAIVKKLNVTN